MTYEEFKEAYDAGYKAGVEFHMDNGTRLDNPYTRDDEDDLWMAWDSGFTLAGEDS